MDGCGCVRVHARHAELECVAGLACTVAVDVLEVLCLHPAGGRVRAPLRLPGGAACLSDFILVAPTV